MYRFALALVLVSSTAIAQDEPVPASTDGVIEIDPETGQKILWRRETVVDFTLGAEVNAPIDKPAVLPFFERMEGEFPPMIELRTDWTPEMRDSVDLIG